MGRALKKRLLKTSKTGDILTMAACRSAMFKHENRSKFILFRHISTPATTQFPEISTQSSTDSLFESLSQKSLLNNDNIQSNHDFINQHKKSLHSQRIIAKKQKSANNESYPDIFKSIDNASTPQQIKQLVIDCFLKEYDHVYNDLRDTMKQQPINDTFHDLDGYKLKTQRAPNRASIITHGMRALFALRQYKFAWDLYEIAKSENYVSNDLYSLVIFGKMHQSPNNHSLDACFELFALWKTESETECGLHINAKIYAALIAACMKVKNYGRAWHVYNNLICKDLDNEMV